jgi:hypothetical protein
MWNSASAAQALETQNPKLTQAAKSRVKMKRPNFSTKHTSSIDFIAFINPF